MKSRIAAIIEKEGLTASQFADILGVQRSSVSHILNGRNNPSVDFISKLLEAFPLLNAQWLITGTGSMHLDRSALNEIPSPVVNKREPNLLSLFDTPKDSEKIERASVIQPTNTSKAVVEPIMAGEQAMTEDSEEPDRASQGTSEQENMPGIKYKFNDNPRPVHRKIMRIIVFYDDHSFEELTP